MKLNYKTQAHKNIDQTLTKNVEENVGKLTSLGE